MIYADPTELRDDSVIPDKLAKITIPLPSLESLTGADFLISKIEIPPLSSSVGKIVLKSSLSTGLLIQRKSGSDFLGSIHDLPEILARMQEWQESPWLVVTRLSPGPRDTVKVRGSSRKNKWRWSSVSGSLDAWQDRGGCLKELADDHSLTDWFLSRERKVAEWEVAPEKLVTHKPVVNPPKSKLPKQKIKRVDPGWYNTRLAWPKGVGESQLSALARYIVSAGRPPTLANAISLACSSEAMKVKGWGKKSVASVRAWYGVTDSLSNDADGAPSWCMIYDWHEGILVVEGDELYRVEKRALDDIPAGAIVYERSE